MRMKPKPVDPAKRRAKRLRQASRLAAKYERNPPTSPVHVARARRNALRVAALEAGTWPVYLDPEAAVVAVAQG